LFASAGEKKKGRKRVVLLEGRGGKRTINIDRCLYLFRFFFVGRRGKKKFGKRKGKNLSNLWRRLSIRKRVGGEEEGP